MLLGPFYRREGEGISALRLLVAGCCHLYFTLAAYNLVLLFKTKYARKLMGRTTMTLRNRLFSTEEMAVVYVQGCFGLFTLEELLKLLERAPP